MDLNQERISPNLFDLESILILNVSVQESGIVLSRLFSTVTYCIAFQFSSESKRAISWVDKEDKLSPVAMPLIILKTFPPKILLLLPRVCRFEECTNLVATSENK